MHEWAVIDIHVCQNNGLMLSAISGREPKWGSPIVHAEQKHTQRRGRNLIKDLNGIFTSCIKSFRISMSVRNHLGLTLHQARPFSSC